LDLPELLASEWAAWWPAHAVWISFGAGSVIFVRDQAWSKSDQSILCEWIDIWGHEFNRGNQPRLKSPMRWMKSLGRTQASDEAVPWWRLPKVWAALLLAGAMLFPVRLTVLASAELTPANPAVIRAPVDGVIDVFYISPNQVVKKDQLLFGFDELLTKSRLDVARKALSTAEAEYRQTVHQAMMDVRARNQLSGLKGKIEEKRAEVDFLVGQLGRTRVLAPQAGFVLMDEPSEWIGRPVAVGERILRIASPDDIEIEAWLALNDAISLAEGAELSLFLNSNPLNAVKAKIRYVAHDAIQRPDGFFAYRVRAVLTETTSHRVGLKGTAKIYGDWVPMVYWMLRRPIASARAYLGL
jgi:multidrug efflux pump subunit AcrA (membrane-fusion protein)